MEWIIENWYFIIFPALIVAMYFFGHRKYGQSDEHGDGHEGNPGESSAAGTKKGGHGCCH
jgi:hypothetical protein